MQTTYSPTSEISGQARIAGIADTAGGVQGDPASDVSPRESAVRASGGLRQSPFLRDVALTMGAECAVMTLSLVVISLVGRLLGPTALAEYLLVRRVLAWLTMGTLVGLGTALPRYVARAAAQSGTNNPSVYFWGASALLILSSLIFGVIAFIFRGTLADWLFGDSRRGGLVIALALVVAGLAAQTAVFGYYRGLLTMVRANAIQVCNMGLIPLAVVLALYRTHSIPWIVGLIGLLTVMCSGLFATPLLRRLTFSQLSGCVAGIVELLRYGIPRVPGDFGMQALMALGPVVAAHFVPMAEVASLLLGLSMLMVTGYAAGPLSVVLLSKLSMMLGQNRMKEVRARLEYLMTAIPEISVFACIHLTVFADVLVHFWVGAKFPADILVIRMAILAIPPYLFYMALRSTIDAVTVKPINAGNVITGLVVFFALLGVSVKLMPGKFMMEGIAGSLFVALIVLGSLTVRTFHRFYGLSVPWSRLVPSLLAAIAFGAAAFGLRWLQPFPVGLVQMACLELGLGLAYFAILVKLGSPWVKYLLERGLRGKANWPLKLRIPRPACG